MVDSEVRRCRRRTALQEQTRLGLPAGCEGSDPASAGWALVFHQEEDPDVRRALLPLIRHRQELLNERRVKCLEVRSGEEPRDWLARHGVELGSVEPQKVPYYLALVGDPTRIPFSFQTELTFEYCIGRIDLDDPDDYACYAHSLIEHETTRQPLRHREAVFFAPRHDDATRTTADRLAGPLFGRGDRDGVAPKASFRARGLFGRRATKNELRTTFAGEGKRPAILFTAGHGLAWPAERTEQREAQGALLCHRTHEGEVRVGERFAGEDLEPDASVHGMLAFLFACYGGGTPRNNGFHFRDDEPRYAAEESFVAALPKALLSHRRGSALAVVAHLDRAWTYSVVGLSGQTSIQPFENTLIRWMRGLPVGWAVKDFGDRFAALTIMLDEMQERCAFGAPPPTAEELVALRSERVDARNYLVLGDPAVRLRPELWQ